MNRIVYEEVKDESDGTTPRLEEALHDAWSYAPGEMPGKYIGKRKIVLEDGEVITFRFYYDPSGSEHRFRYRTEPEYKPGRRKKK